MYRNASGYRPCIRVISVTKLYLLPDKPFEVMGSVSGWMGNAGVLSLEPRADAMHAQHRIHSTRGASIPHRPIYNSAVLQKYRSQHESSCAAQRLIQSRVRALPVLSGACEEGGRRGRVLRAPKLHLRISSV